MSISNYLELKILDKVFKDTAFTSAPVFVSLHNADPGETGANEVAGGGYARQQVAASGWNAAVGGLTDNVGAVTFANMPAVPAPGVVAFGLFDAATSGNCLWTGWLGNHAYRPCAVLSGDLAGNTIQSPAHGYAAGHNVIFDTEIAGTIPTGLNSGTLYYVIAAGLTADAFSVSVSSGGAAVDITAIGTALARRVEPKIVANAGDSFQFNAGDLDFTAF